MTSSPGRPFTFLADAFDVSSARELGEKARAAEEIGVTTFVLPDHLVGQLAPVPYLATVAALTERIRISAFVHNNDLHHPAVLAQQLATLDVLSEGRLDVAIGAGCGRRPLRQPHPQRLPVVLADHGDRRPRGRGREGRRRAEGA
jgi:alkanesulfonate monooxygenase SsuD/methylene tetrahydromethanopterin reductase-like flavin-dependent oxidoreductase (luciferase family)